MNNFNEHQRVIASTGWSLSNINFGISQSRLALAACAIAMLAIGGFFLINYPLETLIVTLFMGSIFSMGRK